ncbi:MAG: hypothetical protein ABW123_16310 [Cystobacter sp.]
MIVAGALMGCSGGNKTESKTESVLPGTGGSGPASAAPASGSGLTAFEESLVGPLLTEVRAGVQPWGEQGIGICQGQGRDCPEFLGTNVGELPPGQYMVRAELKVPQVGSKGTWRVRMETQCTTTRKTERGSSVTTNSSSKEYDVQYAGSDHGSRLSPLLTIRSPDANGAKDCTYTLTSLNPDAPMEWKGSWSVPQA